MGLIVDNCESCSNHIDKGDWMGEWWKFWVMVGEWCENDQADALKSSMITVYISESA